MARIVFTILMSQVYWI